MALETKMNTIRKPGAGEVPPAVNPKPGARPVRDHDAVDRFGLTPRILPRGIANIEDALAFPDRTDEFLCSMTDQSHEDSVKGDVLVVEDDPITQRFLTHLLQSQGYRARVCDDGSQAVGLVISDRPDVILLDLGLPSPDPFSGPHFDGLNVMDWLSRMVPGEAPPVIVITARDISVKPQVMQAGAFAFFQKPADRDQLLETIARALSTPRASATDEP